MSTLTRRTRPGAADHRRPGRWRSRIARLGVAVVAAAGIGFTTGPEPFCPSGQADDGTGLCVSSLYLDVSDPDSGEDVDQFGQRHDLSDDFLLHDDVGRLRQEPSRIHGFVWRHVHLQDAMRFPGTFVGQVDSVLVELWVKSTNPQGIFGELDPGGVPVDISVAVDGETVVDVDGAIWERFERDSDGRLIRLRVLADDLQQFGFSDGEHAIEVAVLWENDLLLGWVEAPSRVTINGTCEDHKLKVCTP